MTLNISGHSDLTFQEHAPLLSQLPRLSLISNNSFIETGMLTAKIQNKFSQKLKIKFL